jgi:predicted PurR-regulated permease PerM
VLFAVTIGFTTLIPYASPLTIVLVSLLLALDNPRQGLEVLAVAISVGQVVDQVIQPRLMGSIVGLQPAWLLICLPIGARLGSLLGLGERLGLLLAVPLVASGTHCPGDENGEHHDRQDHLQGHEQLGRP